MMSVRRMKTYTAQSGYVYQYYFVGQRPALDGDSYAPATEYVFDVATGPGATYAISVFVGVSALANWASAHGRELAAAEQYAVAKMRLLRGLEEVVTLAESVRRLLVSAENIEELMAELGC